MVGEPAAGQAWRRALIIVEPRETIARWVFGQIRDEAGNESFFRLPYWAMGFCDKGGQIRGGIVYHTHRGTTLEAMAAGLPGWLTPQRTRAMFAYGFDGIGSQVIIVSVAKANRRSRQLVERLGFGLRGVIPRAYAGRDAMIYSMHRDDCRWVKDKGL